MSNEAGDSEIRAKLIAEIVEIFKGMSSEEAASAMGKIKNIAKSRTSSGALKSESRREDRRNRNHQEFPAIPS